MIAVTVVLFEVTWARVYTCAARYALPYWDQMNLKAAGQHYQFLSAEMAQRPSHAPPVTWLHDVLRTTTHAIAQSY